MDRLEKRFINFIVLVLALLGLPLIALAPVAKADEFVITGNGEGSSNQVNVSQNNDTTAIQNNDATINNDVSVTSNSGNNQASGNTGGQTSVETGSVSTSVDVENSANASVVNVGCCSSSGSSAQISGNGSDSNNQINISQDSTTTVNISNTATITTNIKGYANTGKNIANDNNGDVVIRTGFIEVEDNIKNGPVNISNVSLTVGQSLGYLLKIHGNSTDSENKIVWNQNNNTNLNILNQTRLDNILSWYLNTGENSANDNNGDVLIATGDIDFLVTVDNGPINTSIVDIDCCHDGDPGEDNPSPNNNPSSPTPSGGPGGNGGSGSGGGGSVLGAVTSAVGQVLPVTGGNWLYLMTLISGILFALGLYLRLHPGNDPGKRFAYA